MKEGALHELPGGWLWTKLGDIIEVIRGASPRPKGDPRYFGGNIPWIMISDISRQYGKYISRTRDTVTEEGAKRSRYLKTGTLILSNSGTVCVPKILAVDGCIHDGFVAFPEVNSELETLFLYHYFHFIRPEIIQKNRQGITQVNLNTNIVKSIEIPLPPLPEQRAIVSKIEQLFSDLDNGIENFKKAQAQLKLYRQSVLKAACEGKLVPTEAELARAEGRDYEAADVLLARILEERREKWNGKGKFKEPDAPDTSGLPKQPEGWGWATLEQLSWDSGYGTSEKCDYNFSGPPVLRIPNINEGRINLNNIKYASESTNLNETESLVYGDMLVIRTNGSKDLIGRAGAVTQNFNKPYFFASYLIRFRIVEFGGLPIWLSSIWQTLRIRSWIESFAATSAGQYNISMSTLNKLPLELPPLAEQRRIVAEVERRLSVCDKMEEIISESLQKAESLRQSILKKAFEGKLLNKKELEKARNAPDWEPAEKLLERIRQEKQIKEKNNKPARRRTHG
ncbi:MAG: restriction endonuclease subunit S [Candidatus Methanoperedens sp.]|nr:restriction endonuclease subunit S [Candidatus Methanoperedens sp.]CAG1007632.1 Type-1 restriction enzyme EcoKI specificity protein [Methanosarcinales archaeon]